MDDRRLLGSINTSSVSQDRIPVSSAPVASVHLADERDAAEDEVAAAASVTAASAPGCYRWLVVLLMGLAGVLVLWTRTGQSVAIIPWSKECGWSDADKQMQLSAFFYGYVGSMWLGPVLSNAFGGHRAFGGIVFCAVVSQALGPLAGCNGEAAGAVRVLVGAFEGPFYPTVGFLLCRWFASSEYSRAQTIMVVGATGGAQSSSLGQDAVAASLSLHVRHRVFRGAGWLPHLFPCQYTARLAVGLLRARHDWPTLAVAMAATWLLHTN